jgi:hypothetical protein
MIRELAEAHRQAEVARAGFQQVSAPLRVGVAEYTLGCIAQAQGAVEAAEGHFTAAVARWRELNQPGYLALGLSTLAHLWAAEGRAAAARPLARH